MRDTVRSSYDRLAAEYCAHIFDELDGKPIDRALLDEVARRSPGPICDLGCGPGHVARHLADRGAEVCGVDLSPGMIGEARRLNPGLSFEVGDMRSLAFPDGSLGGVVAMYSLIHLEREEIAAVAAEVRRVLAPQAVFLGGFHRGSEVRRVEELWGQPVDLDFHFYEPEEITAAFHDALTVERVVERDPYPGVEVETRRFYVVAVRPGAALATTRR
ncbi:MAG: class I SAM-dependent DNA methyltransferase [Candidatus Dormibacteria bacterium]